jgi:4-hydroxybenzoyl-CoA thioesterase
MSETFERVWTVRFADTDPHGIAHYPRIVEAVHETAEVFMQEIGWPFWRTHGQEGFGLPIVEATFGFERPLEGGDEVAIVLVPDLGERSVRFEYDARRGGETAFTADEQRVCQATGEEGAMTLPDDLRAAMAPYAED